MSGLGRPLSSVIFILCIAAAIAPLSFHMFLPALPVVRDDFAAPTALVQMSLSVPAFFIAPAMLFYGPMADRFGRRPVMLAGATLFLVGSLACLFAPGVGLLILGRIVQQVGVSAAMVVPRAVITDLCEPEDVAANIAKLMLILLVFPAAAPAFGSHLVEWFGWRSVFALHAAFGLLLLFLLAKYLPETVRMRRVSLNFRQMIGDFHSLLKQRSYLGYSLNCSSTFAVWLCFVSLAPYLLARLGVDAKGYGVWFLLTASGSAVGSLIAGKLSRQWGYDKMIKAGNMMSLAAIASVALIALFGMLTPLSLFLPMAIVAAGFGIANPNANAAAVGKAPHMAGTAASLIGFFQHGAAALGMTLSGFLDVSSLFPLLVAMFLGMFLSLTGLKIAMRGD